MISNARKTYSFVRFDNSLLNPKSKPRIDSSHAFGRFPVNDSVTARHEDGVKWWVKGEY